jgi:hypothetical protein
MLDAPVGGQLRVRKASLYIRVPSVGLPTDVSAIPDEKLVKYKKEQGLSGNVEPHNPDILVFPCELDVVGNLQFQIADANRDKDVEAQVKMRLKDKQKVKAEKKAEQEKQKGIIYYD